MTRHHCLLAATLLCSLLVGEVLSAPIPTRLEVRDGQPQLIRNGEPYTIRGVGGSERLDLLVALGGNSVRTWSADGLQQLLDDAHERGLTVCVGLWLGHERHGFNYNDDSAVLGQLDKCLTIVRRFKDHPAVLMWGIGNEMEGDGKNPAIWYAVEHIAREVKQADPQHPTMTVIAELGESKLQRLERLCPSIDIVGVNSYGGIRTLTERYRKSGCTKPFIVTEHGPPGPWEVEKTTWGTPIEPSSSAKAELYSAGYRATAGDPNSGCLGTYAFLWGNKQETTATWFGMWLPDGSRLAAADRMSTAWTGRPPQNRVPVIESLTLTRNADLKPGAEVAASLKVTDPEGEELAISWIVRSDAGTIGAGGDAQAEESAFNNAVRPNGSSATLIVPEGGGNYRLFAYVRDTSGGAAVANVPFHVDAPIKPLPAPIPNLPLVVYGDDAKGTTYTPSGYMGNTQSVSMTLDSTTQPFAGKTCLKAEYTATDGWGGVLWQSPPNDWEGTRPGGFDLSQATHLEFHVRGDSGGEVVNFVVGGSGDGPYADTGKAELNNIRVTDKWQRLRIPLAGRDMTRVKTGFGWSAAGAGKPLTFYLDDIRFIRVVP